MHLQPDDTDQPYKFTSLDTLTATAMPVETMFDSRT